MKGLAGREGTVSGCGQAAAAGGVLLLFVTPALALPVEVGLVQSSDVILPVLVLSPPQPTGGFLSPRSCQTALHPCTLPFFHVSLLICFTHAPPCPLLFPGGMNFGSCSCKRLAVRELCRCLWKVGSPHPCFLLYPGQSERLPQGLREARTKRGATLSPRRSSRLVYKSDSQVSTLWLLENIVSSIVFIIHRRNLLNIMYSISISN